MEQRDVLLLAVVLHKGHLFLYLRNKVCLILFHRVTDTGETDTSAVWAGPGPSYLKGG